VHGWPTVYGPEMDETIRDCVEKAEAAKRDE
jgi:hypothetical protein